MKKRLWNVWLAVCIAAGVAACMAGVTVNAQAEEITQRAASTKKKYGDYTYSDIPNGAGTVQILGYSGSEKNIVIPEQIEDKKVAAIGSSAFRLCEATSITVPDTVTKIDNYAFSQCYSLAHITLSGRLTEIGKNAFYHCSTLADIELPANVETIGDYAFEGCGSLSGITIPDGVTEIGVSMFEKCESLLHVGVPESVKKIKAMAFRGCSKLSGITVSYDLTEIGRYAFSFCSSLKGITWMRDGKEMKGTLPPQIQKIELGTFEGCLSFTDDFTIPSGVAEIGESAFSECRFSNVTIPSSVAKIGEDAFHQCYNLKDIWYDSSKTQWQALMAGHPSDPTKYHYHDPLFSAVIHCADGNIIQTSNPPDGSQPQPGPGGSQSQTDPSGNEGEAGQGQNAPDDGKLYIVGKYTYRILNQKEAAFLNPGKQKKGSVTIPATVTIVGKRYQVTKIADKACQNTQISKMKIGKNVKTIGAKAFYNCKKLTSVTIPKNVRKIGKQAFAGCKSLKKITVQTTKLTAKNIGSNAFKGIFPKARFHLPKKKPKGYKKLFSTKGASQLIRRYGSNEDSKAYYDANLLKGRILRLFFDK